MDYSVLQIVASQLSYRLPTLLACAFGFVLAIIYYRRCRAPSLILMIAIGLIVIASPGTDIVQALLMQASKVGEDDYSRNLQMATIVHTLGSVIQAGALALLMIAVFASRRSESP